MKTNLDHTAAVILAAGKGTRMRSGKTNKVALTLGGKPIVAYAVENLQKIGLKYIIVVVGHAKQSVTNALGQTVTYRTQAKRLGTGHALKQAIPALSKSIDTVISMYGDDSAFYPPTLLTTLLKTHHATHSAITVVTINHPKPEALGRIIRSQNGNIAAIVEEKVATPEQKQIHEINTGLYCFNRAFLDKYVPKIKKNPTSKEYYLTDLIDIAVKNNQIVTGLLWPKADIWHGINHRSELEAANQKMATQT